MPTVDEVLRSDEIRLLSQIETGQRRAAEIREFINRMVIQDVLVPPKRMKFEPAEHNLKLTIPPDVTLSIHPHAMSQMCQKVGFPTRPYGAQLLRSKYGTELFAHSLNVLFTNMQVKEGTRYLHRVVDGEVRGFLGRRFGRHIASKPLLDAFLGSCAKSEAQPVDAYKSSVRSSVTCVQPRLHEVLPRLNIALGVQWSNSDFGAGKHRVSMCIWTPGSGVWALSDIVSQVHIGSILEDSDMEVSEHTAQLELRTQISAINDSIGKFLSGDAGRRIVEALREMHGDHQSWATARSALAKVLSKEDLLNADKAYADQVEWLPPVSGDTVPATWLASFVGHIATKKDDAERRQELEKWAGDLLLKYAKGSVVG